jgi:hypothetical protein
MRKQKSRSLSRPKKQVDYIPHDTNFDLSILNTPLTITNNNANTNRPIRPVKLTADKPKENIYDLSNLNIINNDIEIKKENTKTLDEKKLLKGYIEVPQNEWDTIVQGLHIRYLRKDGAFRRGGFVKNSWIGASGKYKDKKVLQLGNSMSYKATKWTIVLDDINKIWKNNNNIYTMPNDNKDTINLNKESITYLNNKVDQLIIDIAKINNEQQRLVNLIKKLHNIKPRSLSQDPDLKNH